MISTSDLEMMAASKRYGGYGYLGNGNRTAESDASLVEAANQLSLDQEDVFIWVNSRFGRHEMDNYDPSELTKSMQIAWFRHHLETGLLQLKEELANVNKVPEQELARAVKTLFLEGHMSKRAILRYVDLVFDELSEDDFGSK